MLVSLEVGWSLDLLGFGARLVLEIFFWGLGFGKIHENFTEIFQDFFFEKYLFFYFQKNFR